MIFNKGHIRSLFACFLICAVTTSCSLFRKEHHCLHHVHDVHDVIAEHPTERTKSTIQGIELCGIYNNGKAPAVNVIIPNQEQGVSVSRNNFSGNLGNYIHIKQHARATHYRTPPPGRQPAEIFTIISFWSVLIWFISLMLIFVYSRDNNPRYDAFTDILVGVFAISMYTGILSYLIASIRHKRRDYRNHRLLRTTRAIYIFILALSSLLFAGFLIWLLYYFS